VFANRLVSKQHQNNLPTYLCHRNHPPRDKQSKKTSTTSQGVPSKPHSPSPTPPAPRSASAAPSKHGPHPIPYTQHSPQDYASRAARPHTTRTSARSCVQANPTHIRPRNHAADHRPHRTAPAPGGTTLNIRTGTCMPERRTRAARRHGCATPSQPDGHACAPTSTCCPAW
jgi:hypothetical protein